MLKTQVDDSIWLVHQPDHARVSGFFAAHWGNHEFASPGSFAPSSDPERLRQEVILAIAEHDNGWWEWEADPPIDPADGLPLGLADVGRQSSGEGLHRWRLGVPRLQASHPYVSLLISRHAYWLYAFAFDDIPNQKDEFRHPLFGAPGTAINLGGDLRLTRAFLNEQAQLQAELIGTLKPDAFWSAAVEPAHLDPHFRLLQLLDALSLSLCFGGRKEYNFPHIPRQSWDDRISLHWRPTAERSIVCDPYPFDMDPLDVYLPMRIVPNRNDSPANEDLTPLARLHAAPLQSIRFQLTSKP